MKDNYKDSDDDSVDSDNDLVDSDDESVDSDDESVTSCDGIRDKTPTVIPSMACELGEMNNGQIDPDINQHDRPMVSHLVIF